MVVARTLRFTHPEPLLKSDEWFSFRSRIIFHLCAIAYQTVSFGEPSYLLSIISLAPEPRVCRYHLFSVPGLKHTLPIAVYTPWNSPPELNTSISIVYFRHYLKTHLSRHTYASFVFIASNNVLMNFASNL